MLAIGKTLTAQERLFKATTAIIGQDEFIALSGVLMIGEKKVVDGLPTACTNGRDEAYGREFVESLTDPEFRFLILHECYHKLYRHLTTWRQLYEEDRDRANRACDYAINIRLADTDLFKRGWIKMPDGGLINETYRGMDVHEIYKLLPPGNGGSGSEGGGDNPFDDHDWEGAQSMSEEEADNLKKQIDEAVRQGATLASKTGSGGNRAFSDLLKTEKDWVELLREYVSTTCSGKDYSTWRKPNRRYVGMDIIMPSAISETLGEIVVAIDTSGSIGQHELEKFLTEIMGICDQVKPSKVRIIYWDTSVCSDEVYLQDELYKIPAYTKPNGGGGTDVECVPIYMNEHDIKPECVVVLTDGYLGGSWGEWNVPVLWCILNNARANASVGVTIHID
jgi:predicted metal-dependent peptidase